MADTMQGLKRTSYCGDLRIESAETGATVCGWVQRQRDKGSLIFIDLRDRTGIVQLVFDENTAADVFAKARECRSEFVLCAKGIVRERAAQNPDLPTGDIEIAVTDLRILGRAQTPPFEITDGCKTSEDIRLKYRYLDLRRPELRDNILLRHRIMQTTRRYFSDNDFIEIETPMMIRSTPEGARDYIVPSRLHKGSFYALPQSPQLYKQLLMVSGFDRYFQLARCFRDEDLRADRQPEFTQVDIEMSFVETEDVLAIGEGYIKSLFKEVLDVDIPVPFPRLTYKDAMERYGSDKPDTRFGMELINISDIAKDTGFGVFTSAIEAGGSVRAVVAKNAAAVYTRKEIDKLTETARGIGAKGLAYIRWSDESPNCSFAKFLGEGQLESILERVGAEKGDVVIIMADRDSLVLSVLGALRLEMAKKLDIIPDGFDFLWVVEFPFFEWDADSNTWVAMHHPFTSPLDECIEFLDSDPGKVRAKAYDMVLNGVELLSGSIRITDPDLQNRMFTSLGFSDEEAARKFGFLLGAFGYGAPPHGGLAFGFDRLVMLICGTDSIRDVIAFPKIKDASEPMTSAPNTVDDKQLDELGIEIRS